MAFLKVVKYCPPPYQGGSLTLSIHKSGQATLSVAAKKFFNGSAIDLFFCSETSRIGLSRGNDYKNNQSLGIKSFLKGHNVVIPQWVSLTEENGMLVGKVVLNDK